MTVCLGLREFRGDPNALLFRDSTLMRLALLRRPPLLLELLRLLVLFRLLALPSLPCLLVKCPPFDLIGDLGALAAIPAKVEAFSS